MIKKIKEKDIFIKSLHFETDEKIKELYKKIVGNSENQEDDVITLYHGSDRELRVEDIKFPGLRDRCDFGKGFYLTNDREIAEEWVRNIKNPIINEYALNLSTQSILELDGDSWIHVILM